MSPEKPFRAQRFPGGLKNVKKGTYFLSAKGPGNIFFVREGSREHIFCPRRVPGTYFLSAKGPGNIFFVREGSRKHVGNMSVLGGAGRPDKINVTGKAVSCATISGWTQKCQKYVPDPPEADTQMSKMCSRAPRGPRGHIFDMILSAKSLGNILFVREGSREHVFTIILTVFVTRRGP